jgi:hypothetical protein
MKKIFIPGLLLLCIHFSARSQTFEGTIRVGTDVQVGTAEETAKLEEMTKAPLRGLLEQERKRLEDPSLRSEDRAELEEKVKEHERLLSTPLLKTYADAKIKGKHAMVTYRGGKSSRLLRNSGEFIFDLSHEDKTYKVEPKDVTQSWGKSLVLVKTNETEKILDYDCIKYVVTSNDKGGKSETTIWASPDITDVDWPSPLGCAGEDTTVIAQIKGMPLKIVSVMEKSKITTEVLSISRVSYEEADFLIPPDYKDVTSVKGRKKK